MPTIDDGIQIYLFHLEGGKSSTPKLHRKAEFSTLRTWRRCLQDAGIDPETTALETINPSYFTEFVAWLKRSKYQPRGKGKRPTRFKATTVRSYLIIFRNTLEYWYDEGWLSFSPISPENRNTFRPSLRMKPAKILRQLACEVPPDFGYRMLAAAMSLPLPPKRAPILQRRRYWVLRARALIAVFVSTGFRVSDVCRLTIAHYKAARTHKGKLLFDSHLTGSPRSVFFPREVMDILRQYIAVRPPISSDLIFLPSLNRRNAHARRMTEMAVLKTVRRIGLLAYGDGKKDKSIPRFCTSHAFRHWFVRNKIGEGSSLSDIQAMLGHSFIQSTELIYGSEEE